jgi:hypothetical protein
MFRRWKTINFHAAPWAAKSARTYTTTTVTPSPSKMLVADYSDRVPSARASRGSPVPAHRGRRLRCATQDAGNDTARIEPVVRGATYGRRITMDYPNGGGRNLTNFYFRDGKLYEQSVTILPANGDYSSPVGSRFVESLLFNLTRMDQEAGGKPPNIQGCGATIQPFNQ